MRIYYHYYYYCYAELFKEIEILILNYYAELPSAVADEHTKIVYKYTYKCCLAMMTPRVTCYYL